MRIKRPFVALLLLTGASAWAAPKTPSSEQAWFKSALDMVAAKNYSQGIKVLHYLTRIKPEKGLYWFNLGNAQTLAGERKAATVSYRKVIELKSPLAPVAALYLARTLRESGEIDESLAELNSLTPESLPPRLRAEIAAEKTSLQESYLNQALSDFHSGRLPVALQNVELAKSLGTSSDAQLLGSMILMQLGDEEAARRALRSAYAEAANIAQKSDARDLYGILVRGTTQSNFEVLGLETSLGYNSNLYGVSAQDGPVAGAIATIAANYARAWQGVGSVAFNLGLSETVGTPEDRMIRTTLQWNSPLLRKNYSAYLVPKIQLDTQPTSLLLLRLGLGTGIETQGRVIFGAYYQLSRNIPFEDTTAYLLGYSQIAKLYLSARTHKTELGFALVGQQESGPDYTLSSGGVLPSSGKSIGPSLNALWNFSQRTEVSGYLGYLFRFYDHATQPYGETRLDRQLNAGLRGTIAVDSRLRGFVSVQLARNGSTLDQTSLIDKNYVQWTTQGGLTWEIVR